MISSRNLTQANYDFFKSISVLNVNYYLYGNVNDNKIELYSSNPSYSCVGGCTTCTFPTYILNTVTFTCDKSMIVVSNPNNPNNTNKTNELINIANLNNISNTESKYTWFEQLIELITSNFSLAVQLTSNRLTIKSSLYFIIFVDDIEFYQYHRVNYSEVVKVAIYNTNIINNIRIGP